MSALVPVFLGSATLRSSQPGGPNPAEIHPLVSGKVSAGWLTWTPRAEISPQFSVDVAGGHKGESALRIETRDRAEVGGWRQVVAGIRAGHTYRFSAWFRGEKIDNEERSVIARLAWLDADRKPFRRVVRAPEYPTRTGTESGWSQLAMFLQAPESAEFLDIQLILAFAPNATLWWDEIMLSEVAPPPERPVRVTTVHFRPEGASSHAQSVERFCTLARQSAADRPDIVCLPEGITIAGTGGGYVTAAEPIPGPTTERLGRLARELDSHVVAGLYERVGTVIYNTAVLIGRDGGLVGRYRKTHLPAEEWERGLTPGDSYPVFDTDFGRVGILICWDARFPEPCRSMAEQGAKLILMPTWGGSDLLARARALENHVHLVTAGYDMRSAVIDPTGVVVAEATVSKPIVTHTVYPERKFYEFWVGDMGARTWKERRGDLPTDNLK